MHTLSQAGLLNLWETGRSLHPLDRGLLAVEATATELATTVADWPLGRRNRALAELHTTVFGRRLRGWTECRACRERLEFDVDAMALADHRGETQSEPYVTYRERRYRLPTSRDLAAMAVESSSESLSQSVADLAARRLVERCCLARQPEARQCEVSGSELELSEADIDAIGEQMAAADPLAEILLHFDCPACNASFEENLDLTSFLWAEIERKALRVLRDVHILAAAYGWSESGILALPPARRAAYIEMVQA
jgi:hypothetical protein